MALYFNEAFRKEEYELLTDILGFMVPRDKVDELADKLLERYGCICNILNSTAADLQKIDIVTEKTAVWISYIMAMHRYNILKMFGKRPKLDDSTMACMYASALIKIGPYETFSAFILDKNKCLVENAPINSGTVSHVLINTRALIDAVMRNNGKYVIAVHTHPNGRAKPSIDDIRATENLYNALAAVDIVLLDHIIVSRTGCESMVELGGF